jgi:prepilin-type N-terminal cleavage/methylation domain-containing protein
MDTRRSEERGYTLIELLVTVTLMAIAFGAVFGGLGLFFKIQATQRANAQIDTEIRNYAERLLDQPYVDCATTSSYSAATQPTGYTTTVTLTYWDGKLPAGYGSSCTKDLGVQQITIKLSNSRGDFGTLTLGKSR